MPSFELTTPTTEVHSLTDRSCRSQWPRGLRLRTTVVHLLGSWVPIPPATWTFVCYESFVCVLSGRGLCDELAPRPGSSHLLWCVVVCNFGTSWLRSKNIAGWTVGRRLQQIENVAVWISIKYLVSLQRLGGIVSVRERKKQIFLKIRIKGIQLLRWACNNTTNK